MSDGYLTIASYGRGAGTDRPFFVSFDLSIKRNPIAESIRGLSPKTGITVKKINGGGKCLSGFINIGELHCMKARVIYAQNQILERAISPDNTPAEYVFKMGEFKGKTPSQLLLGGTDVGALENQKAFLLKNATGKFAEANKKGAADIEAAIKKFKEGTLVATDVKSSSIPLFRSGPRYFVKKVAQPYQTEGWELNITCFPGDKNPFLIEWQSKTVTIDKNVIVEASNVKTESCNLTEGEFIDMWETLILKLNAAELEDQRQRIQYSIDHKDDWKNNKSSSSSAPAPEKSSFNPASILDDDEPPFN